MEEIHLDRIAGLAAPIDARLYEGRVARIHPDGDPLQYTWGDEYRDAAGLQQIADQLVAKPFSLLHPSELIAKGGKADIVGRIVDSRVDGQFVVAQILVTDARAIAAINSGMHELSLGYTSSLDSTRRQRDIRVDHIALVPKARCGTTCALRTDSHPGIACTCNSCTISYNTSIVVDSPNTDAALTAATRHELPGHMFAAPDSKSLPIEDETHVRAAMARFNQTDFKGPSERKAAYHHIVARAHQLGIDPAGFEKTVGNRLDDVGHLDHQGTIVMDELQKKLGEALATAATEKARADQLDIELTATKTKLTASEIAATNAQAALGAERKLTEAANLAATQAKADAATAIAQAKLDAGNTVASAVTARVQLLTEANQVLGAKDSKGQLIDRSAMGDQELRLAVIKHVDNLEFPKDKDPVFVQGVYAGSLARAAAAASSRTAVREATVQVRSDAARVVQQTSGNAARTAELAAQKAMQDDQAKRWRTKAN